MKYINNFLMNKKLFFVRIFLLVSLSSIISHNSQICVYLYDINPWIEHLGIFCKSEFWFYYLKREKRSRSFEYSNSGALILLHWEQQFNLQSHFGFFVSVIGEVHWYYGLYLKDMICVCKLFVNILFLYSF